MGLSSGLNRRFTGAVEPLSTFPLSEMWLACAAGAGCWWRSHAATTSPTRSTSAAPHLPDQVWRDSYCGDHDHGINWTAGDWYDLVVDRIWSGHPTRDRVPTEPEVRELIRRGEEAVMSYTELAHRLGLAKNEYARWRDTLARSTPQRSPLKRSRFRTLRPNERTG